VLVPLHNPIHLAKEVATLQELSGGRLTLEHVDAMLNADAEEAVVQFADEAVMRDFAARYQ
jgi:alkanesulfonate monooxygenase SsuD/methylene tetrahydromethanopterin reductase-like flavin-dependent oxidoreductase (luciferase family)